MKCGKCGEELTTGGCVNYKCNVNKFTEEQLDMIRQLISDEITKKLNFNFDNYGFETMGLKITIEYDGRQLEHSEL